MTAAEIARALGGRREGSSYRCPCPIHGGRSLIVTERRDKTLFRCKGGCEQNAVLAALADLGLFGRKRSDRDSVCDVERKRREDEELKAVIDRLRRRIDTARSLYRRAAPAAGTPVERYLRSRGIRLPIPECLRFLRHCRHRSGGYYPAMVAPVVNVDGAQIGLSATFLQPDGVGKWPFADKRLQRQFYGATGGGAVRLAPYYPHRELAVGEGVESVLSAMELFDLPGWAALSADGIKDLDLPHEVRSVIIAADNDGSGTGQDGALFAHSKWTGERRAVRVLLPPDEDTDFNDVLMTGALS